MKRRRITLVVDAEKWDRLYQDWPESTVELLQQWTGGTVESVEDIPEPNRVQEFRVRVETKPTDNPVTAGRVDRLLCAAESWPRNTTVTKVEPT